MIITTHKDHHWHDHHQHDHHIDHNQQDEFSGPKALAEYLLKLDKDDEAYNQYFKWKVTLMVVVLVMIMLMGEDIS